MKMMPYVLIGLFVAGLWRAPTYAATVEVIVETQTASALRVKPQPIARAAVCLTGLRSEFAKTQYTDQTGRTLFNNVPDQPLRITVSRKGYVGQAKEYRIPPSSERFQLAQGNGGPICQASRPRPAPKPDLTVSQIELIGSICPPTMDLPPYRSIDKIVVTVQNTQNVVIDTAVKVTLKAKKDGASLAEQTGQLPGLTPNGEKQVPFTNPGAGQDGQFEFHVVVDPGQEIAETNEQNNAKDKSARVNAACSVPDSGQGGFQTFQ